MSGTHALAGATDLWQDVIDDLEATATEYADDGWETIVCHPGDVTPLPTVTALANGVEPDRLGLDLLLPGNEYEELAETVEGRSFPEYDVYRAETESLVFLVVVMKSDDDTAVLFPIYYDGQEARPMLKRAAERGELRTYLRPLDDSERVVFSQSEPARLLPVDFDPDEVDERALVDESGSRFPLDADELDAATNDDHTDTDPTDPNDDHTDTGTTDADDPSADTDTSDN